MPARNKRYWVIEITNRKLETVFRKRLERNLRNKSPISYNASPPRSLPAAR